MLDFTPISYWIIVNRDVQQHDAYLQSVKALSESFTLVGRTAESDYHPRFEVTIPAAYSAAASVLLNKSESVYAWGVL